MDELDNKLKDLKEIRTKQRKIMEIKKIEEQMRSGEKSQDDIIHELKQRKENDDKTKEIKNPKIPKKNPVK